MSETRFKVVEKVESPDFEIVFDPKMTKEQIDRVVQALSDYWLVCGGSSPLRVEFVSETAVRKRAP